MKIKISSVTPEFDLDIKNEKNKSLSNMTINLSTCKKVEDEVRGYIIYNGVDWDFVNVYTYKNRITGEKNKKIKTIVLILESPHKDEYDTSYNPIRPANGATGASIEAYIYKYAKLWKLDKDTDYIVWLVNSVQIQASCNHELCKLNLRINDYSLKKIKFNVLINAFDECEFKKRIIEKCPDIVINCCTSTPEEYGIDDIYKKVQLTIESIEDITIYKCYHPSSKKWKGIQLKT